MFEAYQYERNKMTENNNWNMFSGSEEFSTNSLIQFEDLDTKSNYMRYHAAAGRKAIRGISILICILNLSLSHDQGVCIAAIVVSLIAILAVRYFNSFGIKAFLIVSLMSCV